MHRHVWTLFVLALLSFGCGAGGNERPADSRDAVQDAASPQSALRVLHARVLERGPTLVDLDRQEREDRARTELCRAGDVEGLSAMDPGFLDFRRRVLDVPAFEERPVDAVVQGACRRDLTVDIIRDWLLSRGHRSVRFILGIQSSWPEFALLFDRELEGIE